MPSKKKQTRKTSQAAPPVAGTPRPVAPPTSSIAGRSYDTEFNPDYSQTIKDLKRIAILAASFFAVLIILAFILN
jgi:hypothetical protein